MRMLAKRIISTLILPWIRKETWELQSAERVISLRGVMDPTQDVQPSPIVIVIADIESNAAMLVERVLRPAGLEAYQEGEVTFPADVLVVDVTQLMGDPLAGLRNRRAAGDEAPAIILAAHFPQSRMRDFFRLGVADILMKPYRHQELAEAISDLVETRSKERNSHALARKLESSREHARQRSEEIKLLSEIGRTVVNLGNLDRILERVVEAAAFVTDAEEANIYLVDQETAQLSLRASKQAGEKRATLQRLRVTDTLVGQVFRTAQPILRQPSQEGGPLKIQTGFIVRSLINVPIRVQNEVVGVLGVYNRMASRPFTEHHLTLLSALSDWTGVALEHTQLLQESKRAPQPEPIPTTGSLGLQKTINEALDRLNRLLNKNRVGLNDQQLAALEGLRLSLMRSLAHFQPHRISSPQREMVDMPLLLQDIVKERAPIAEEHGLELGMGPSLPMAPFAGNKKPIQQVIDNLTNAAIHRTVEGRIILNLHRFEVENGRPDGLSPPEDLELSDGIWVAVTVADSSIGLSPDVIRALDSEEVDVSIGREGPGLSMSEIRLIAESIDGALWYDQTPAGTTIIFAFPLT